MRSSRTLSVVRQYLHVAPCALTQVLTCRTLESAANPPLMPTWSLLDLYARSAIPRADRVRGASSMVFGRLFGNGHVLDPVPHVALQPLFPTIPCAKRCWWTPCRRCSDKKSTSLLCEVGTIWSSEVFLLLIPNADDDVGREALRIASPLLQPIGSPKVDPVVWLNFTKEWSRVWKIACRMQRCFNHRLSGMDDDTQPCFEFPCPRCVEVSNLKKGVCTHLLRVHGQEFSAFFQVPCFQTEHGTRLRCVHHCQFSSRRCRQEILAGNVPALDPVIVQSLDECDLETRHIARGLGISYLRRDVQEPS